MNVSPQAQAVLLLTAHFSKPRPNDARPLSPTEWGKFALWLRNEKLAPEALLAGNLGEKLASWTDPQITQDRIEQLLGRGSALAIAIEKWLRSGLWVLTRSDSAYPLRLKQRLKQTAPAVLFGCGSAGLLEQRGVAVVGSRNASDEDLAYAQRLGERVADAGATIVSGGARGIDEAAMLGALAAEGTVVGVLADSLLKASSSLKYRKHLLADNLVLLSPFYPEAGFSVGNAMGRNKYIYCLADAAVVVHSGTKGGTWTGALENLDRKWTPTWVKHTRDLDAANAEIAKRGASWLPEDAAAIDVPALLNADAANPNRPRTGLHSADERIADETAKYFVDSVSVTGQQKGQLNGGDKLPGGALAAEAGTDLSFYELFLVKVKKACSNAPQSAADLEKLLDVTGPQLKFWLKRAVDDAKLRKTKRPVKYEWAGDDRQRSIF